MRKFFTVLILLAAAFTSFGAFDDKVEKIIIKEFEKKYKEDKFFCVQSPYYVEDETRNMKLVAALYSEKLNERRDIPIIIEVGYSKKSDVRDTIREKYIEKDIYNRNLKVIERREKIEEKIEKLVKNYATVILIYPENESDRLKDMLDNDNSFPKNYYIKAEDINVIILVKNIEKMDIDKCIEDTKLISKMMLEEIKTIGKIRFNIIDDTYFTETTAKNNVLYRLQRSLFYACLNTEKTEKIFERISEKKKVSLEEKKYLLKRFRSLETDVRQIEIVINNEDYLENKTNEDTVRIYKIETDATGYIQKIRTYRDGQWLNKKDD